MLMSFKTKNSTEINELISSRAVYVLGELKKNILDAKTNEIICPDANTGVGNSISFGTKSGGFTTLSCDYTNGQIASESANGKNYFLSNSIQAINCHNFVWCNLTNEGEVLSIGFTLNLETYSNGVSTGTTGIFYGVVAPRN